MPKADVHLYYHLSRKRGRERELVYLNTTWNRHTFKWGRRAHHHTLFSNANVVGGLIWQWCNNAIASWPSSKKTTCLNLCVTYLKHCKSQIDLNERKTPFESSFKICNALFATWWNWILLARINHSKKYGWDVFSSV